MADKETVDLHAQLDECEKVIFASENESVSDPSVQSKLKQCVTNLEDLTRSISKLSMFSPNEHFDELATSHLRFLLLPVYLGQATQNLQSDDRSAVLDTAEIYFKDFLTRLHSYGIIEEQSLPWNVDELDEDDSNAKPLKPRTVDPKVIREQKIKRYQQQKQMEGILESLRKKRTSADGEDDETVRELYLTQLRLSALKAVSELEEINKERPMLEHMAKLKDLPPADLSQLQAAGCKHSHKNRLKPVIITRDTVQKEVYGLGYPSLPTYTVDEWYQQMTDEGWFPKPGASKAPAHVRTEEESDEEKEERAEKDDSKQLASSRALDEYKDDHRRGWGNRHNKG